MTHLFSAQLEAEVGRTRRALEGTPVGRDDWKPHEKSMLLGGLAALIARMPSWLALLVNRDELDLNPAGGSNFSQKAPRTRGNWWARSTRGMPMRAQLWQARMTSICSNLGICW